MFNNSVGFFSDTNQVSAQNRRGRRKTDDAEESNFLNKQAVTIWKMQHPNWETASVAENIPAGQLPPMVVMREYAQAISEQMSLPLMDSPLNEKANPSATEPSSFKIRDNAFAVNTTLEKIQQSKTNAYSNAGKGFSDRHRLKQMDAIQMSLSANRDEEKHAVNTLRCRS